LKDEIQKEKFKNGIRAKIIIIKIIKIKSNINYS